MDHPGGLTILADNAVIWQGVDAEVRWAIADKTASGEAADQRRIEGSKWLSEPTQSMITLRLDMFRTTHPDDDERRIAFYALQAAFDDLESYFSAFSDQ